MKYEVAILAQQKFDLWVISLGLQDAIRVSYTLRKLLLKEKNRRKGLGGGGSSMPTDLHLEYRIKCPCGFHRGLKQFSGSGLVPRVIICPGCGDNLYGARKKCARVPCGPVWFSYTRSLGQQKG